MKTSRLLFLFAVLAALVSIAIAQPAQELARIDGIVVKAGSGEPLPNAVLLLSKDGAGDPERTISLVGIDARLR